MSDQIDSKLLNEFEQVVAYQVGRNYKKGIFGKKRLQWQLTKVWNSRAFKIGIPGEVRNKLGEAQATKLFQDTADNIINNPTRLQLAVDSYKTEDLFNQA